MLSSINQRMNRDEDEGFTLIELMVVLLIIAILLAIAIPTFLGARNTANARSTQENLRNALTAEQTNYASNQTFAAGLSSIEGALSWQTGSPTQGGNYVSVALYTYGSGAYAASTAGATSDGVELIGYAKDNNCYYIFAGNNPAASFTEYAKAAPSAGACAAITPPTGAASPGTSAATASAGTWSATF
jgi:prepilin-type N-terminal cleavage/methylation domain-containing protein